MKNDNPNQSAEQIKAFEMETEKALVASKSIPAAYITGWKMVNMLGMMMEAGILRKPTGVDLSR